jgi:hypothetical protein
MVARLHSVKLPSHWRMPVTNAPAYYINRRGPKFYIIGPRTSIFSLSPYSHNFLLLFEFFSFPGFSDQIRFHFCLRIDVSLRPFNCYFYWQSLLKNFSKSPRKEAREKKSAKKTNVKAYLHVRFQGAISQ